MTNPNYLQSIKLLKISKRIFLLLLFISSFNLSSQNYILDPLTDGSFEGTHGWTILNTDNENKWIIGSAEKSAGSVGAYISNNNSTNTITNPQVSNSKIYIYKDVVVPANATTISISFKYKNNGTDAPAPRCMFAPTSVYPTLPTNGSAYLVGAEFLTFLNNSTAWTTYNNTSPLTTDRSLTYTSGPLIPGQSYRIVFEWSASYQTNRTQIAPFCTYPSSGSFSGNMTPSPNSTETYTYNTVGGSNFLYTWSVDGGTIVSGQGTNQVSITFPSSFSIGYLRCSLSCPPPVYTTSGKNSGPLAIDEVAISYIATPKITSISPLSGAVGSSVTINGEFFGATSAENVVYLGGSKCVITTASATSLSVTVPTNANFNNFTVLNTTTKLSCISSDEFVTKNTSLLGMTYNSNLLTSFEAPITFTTGTFTNSFDQKFVLSDVDLDGKVDIFSYSSTGVPNVLRNNATSGIVNSSTFVANATITGVIPTSPAPTSRNVFAADLNNDGKLDFANSNNINNGGFTNINTSVSGSPSLQNFTSLLSSTGQYQINTSFLPIDINLDGRTDILGLNGQNPSQALLYFTKNTTTGTTFSSVSGNTTNTNSFNQKLNDTNFYSGSSGDLDGDGKTDVVLSGTGKVYVLKNTTTQGNPDVKSFSFSEPVSKLNASGISYTVKVADLDLDGKLDVIATNTGSANVSVFRNNSTSTNLSIVDAQNFGITGFANTYGLAVADMNGDGKPDLIVSDNSTQIGYLANTSVSGTISFANSVTIYSLAGAAYAQLEVADIDGDNKPDIIAANASNGIVVFRNRVAEAGTISGDQTICNNTIPATSLTSLTPATFSTAGTITYKWQSSTNGTTWGEIATTNTLGYTIPSALTGTTYYRRAAALSTAPTVFYFTNPILVTVTPNPTITVTTPVTSCGTAAVTLSATSSGGVVKWYDALTAGNLLATSNSYTTPTIGSTTTYYALAASSNGCNSTSPRTAVAATIITAVPTISSGTAASRCDAGSLTLSVSLLAATTFGTTVNWYTAATGGTLVGTGTTWVTPSISSTTTYYAEAVNCNGISTSRTAVIATVVITPSIISAVSNSGCKNTNVALSAVPSYSTGVTLNWYVDNVTTSVTSTGSPINAYVSTDVVRYVSAKNGTCESPRTLVTATMINFPAAATAVPTTLCGLATATVSATSVANSSISWYSAATAGTLLGTGSSYTTPVMATTGTYYALVTDANGCNATSRTAVAATYNGATSSVIPNLNAVTNSTNQVFTATIANQTGYIWQRSIDAGLTWVDITASLDPNVTYSGFSGTTGTTATLTLSVALPYMHKYLYRLKLSQSVSCINYSNAATLNVADVFGTCQGGTALTLNNPNNGYTSLRWNAWLHVDEYNWDVTYDENWNATYSPTYLYYYNYGWGSMTDGSSSSGLIVDADGPGSTAYITNDLGSSKVINQVYLRGFIQRKPDYYANPQYEDGPNFDGGSILVSNDNINWTTVLSSITGTGIASNGWEVGSYYTFPSVTARYVRALRYYNQSGLSEFYVYASDLNTTPYIISAPTTPVYVSTGGTFSPNVAVSAGAGTLTYQWSKSSDNYTFTNLSNAGTISGVTTSNLVITTFAAGNIGYYKLTATQSNGCSVSTTIQVNIVAPYYTSAAGSAAMQTLSSWNTGTTGTGGSPPANFTTATNSFILANSASTYTIGANWTNSGSLRLNGKIFTLGNFNATIGSVLEGSTTAYVKTNGTGKLISSTNTIPNIFPVGNTSYNPVTISNYTGTADTYSISVSDAVLASGTTGAAMNNVINRTWTISKTVANTAGTGTTLTFGWNVGDITGLVVDPVLFAYVTGTGWVQQTVGSITRTAASVTFTKYMGTISSTGTMFMLANGAPVITSFTPVSSGTGKTVTISGTNLSNASIVSFGGTAATSFVVNSSSLITAVIGSGTSGSVSVTTPGGTASLAGFTYVAAPTITYFTPTKTNGGTTVTITGTNFNNATVVTFGGTAAVTYTVVSNTVITAVLGTGTSGNITVVTPGGTATASGFVYGIPYTSIDVLAGWNSTNTVSQVYPYLATYTKPLNVVSASNNYLGTTTSTDSDTKWINNNNASVLDIATSPYLSFTITNSVATKFDRLVFPGLSMTTSKIQLRWSIDNFATSLGEITSANGSSLLSSINLATTTTQLAGSIEFRTYFYNGNGDVILMKSGNTYSSLDGTPPTYDSSYAIAFYGVTKPNPTINAVANITKNTSDPAFVLPLPSSNSNGSFTYSSSDNSILSINGTSATINGVGTATITATQAATETYSAGSVTFTVSVKTVPSLYMQNLTATVGDSNIVLNAISNSNGAITYTSGTTSVATIVGNTLAIIGAGTSVITITQAASGNYNASTITAVITVGALNSIYPTLSNFANINKMMSNPAFSLTPPTTNSAGAFTYYSSNALVATISSSTITLVSPGISIITAVQAANGIYRASSISAVLTVGLGANNNPVITNFAPITKFVTDVPFPLTSPTSTSSQPFTYFSSTPSVGSVNGNTVTITGLGVSNITAVQTAGGSFNAGSIATTLTVTNALPAISYSTPNSFTKSVAIINLSPTLTGGVVSSYSIIPSLPVGLTFNTATGVISGTPLAVSLLTTYTVNATNSSGSVSTTLTILVKDSAPSGLAYTTPNVFTIGTTIATMSPTNIGSPLISFTVSPSLPAGLMLNATTGEISGTPALAVSIATYTVTGTNSGGTTTFPIVITVNDKLPSLLEYSTPNIVFKGEQINPLTPSNSDGAISSYAVSPSLPSGLLIDSTTGQISGAPTVTSATTTYRVTGTNSAGSVYKDISLMVNDNAPTNLVYTTPNNFTVGQAISTMTPTNDGGSPTSYSLNASLPDGLLFNTTTGEITGTPTEITANATYIITALNFIGNTSANVEIAINDISPSSLSYSTPNIFTQGEAISNLTPSVSGGTVISYSVSPTLPLGLSINIGTGIISGTPSVIAAQQTYSVTATNSGGSTSFNIDIKVNPSPAYLSSTLTPSSICSSSNFTYSPTSTTSGVVFTWSRALVTGISNAASSGTGNINESLVNTTNAPIDVVYQVTLDNFGTTNTENVTVSVFPTSVGGSITTGINQAICSNSSPSDLIITGNTGNVVRWEKSATSDFASPTTITSTNTTLTTADIGNLTTTTYFRAVVKNGNCSEATSDYATITIINSNIWNGSLDTVWNTADNWNCGVPAPGVNIEIPGGLSNYPELDSSRIIGNVTLASGATLNLNNFTLEVSGTFSGTGTLIGSSTSNLTINGSGTKGTFYMNQTTPGSTNILNNFTLNSSTSGSATLGNTMGISGILTLANGTFNTGGYLTMTSNSSGTAVVAPITNSSTVAITGDVTVERYIPARRAYRLVSSPVTTTTSIRENWQENGNETLGWGTDITGTGGSSNGFDPTATNNASMFTFNNNATASTAWTAVTNTNGTLAAGSAYRLMIRGDRTVDLTQNAATPSITILRAKGALKIGNASAGTLNQNANGFSFIGNPYQATVDIKSVLDNATNLNANYYWVWDPTLNTRGGYVTYDLSSRINPVLGSLANEFLQPWQACFVRTASAGAASINFQESNKSTSTVNQNVYKTTQTNSASYIRLTLYESNTLAAKGAAADGLIVKFGANYDNAIDGNDASKFTNQDENFATKNNTTLLGIESRLFPTASDVVPLNITQYRFSKYTIVANGTNMSGLTTYLHDQLLQTYTEIPQSGSVNYSYVLNSNDATTSNPDRFRIVVQNSSLNLESNTALVFSMYPNPAKEGVFDVIMNDATADTKLQIYNSLGQEVYTSFLTHSMINHINPKKDFPAGVYYVNIKKDDTTTVKKLIIE